MWHFQKDNASTNLHHEVRSWPAAEHFIGVISDGNDDDGSTEFDDSIRDQDQNQSLDHLTQTQFPL